MTTLMNTNEWNVVEAVKYAGEGGPSRAEATTAAAKVTRAPRPLGCFYPTRWPGTQLFTPRPFPCRGPRPLGGVPPVRFDHAA